MNETEETDDAAEVRFAGEAGAADGRQRRRQQAVVPQPGQETLQLDEAAGGEGTGDDSVDETIRRQEELARQHGGPPRLPRLGRTPAGEARQPEETASRSASAPPTPRGQRRVRVVDTDELAARELQARLDAGLGEDDGSQIGLASINNWDRGNWHQPAPQQQEQADATSPSVVEDGGASQVTPPLYGRIPPGPGLDRQLGRIPPLPIAQRWDERTDPALRAARDEINSLRAQVASARRSEATQRTLLAEFQQRLAASEAVAVQATSLAERTLEHANREPARARATESMAPPRAPAPHSRPQAARTQGAYRGLQPHQNDEEEGTEGDDEDDSPNVRVVQPGREERRSRSGTRSSGTASAAPRASTEPPREASASRHGGLSNQDLAHQFRALQIQLEERGIPLASFGLAPRQPRERTPTSRPRGQHEVQPADRRHQFYNDQDWQQRQQRTPPPPYSQQQPRAPPNPFPSVPGMTSDDGDGRRQHGQRASGQTGYAGHDGRRGDGSARGAAGDGGAAGAEAGQGEQPTPPPRGTRRSGGFTPDMPDRRPMEQVSDDALVEEWFVEKSRGPSSAEINAFCDREPLTLLESNIMSQLMGAEANRFTLIGQTMPNLQDADLVRRSICSLRRYNNILIRVMAEARQMAEQALRSTQQTDIPIMTPLPEFYGTEPCPTDIRKTNLPEFAGKLDSSGQPIQDIFSWLMRFAEAIVTLRLSEEGAVRVLRFRLVDRAATTLEGCLPGIIDSTVSLRRIVQHLECHLGSLLDCTVARDLCRAVHRKSGETIFQTLTRARQYAKMAVRSELPVSGRAASMDQMLIQVVLRNTAWEHRKVVEERQRQLMSTGKAPFTADELAQNIFDEEQHSVLAHKDKGSLRFVESTYDPVAAASSQSSSNGAVHAIQSSQSASGTDDRLESIAAQCQQISAALKNPAVLHAMQFAKRQSSPRPARKESRYGDKRSRSQERGSRRTSSSRWSSKGSSRSQSRSPSRDRGHGRKSDERPSRPRSTATHAAISEKSPRDYSNSRERILEKYKVDIHQLGLDLPCCFKCGDKNHFMNDREECPYGKYDLASSKCGNCGVGGHTVSSCVKQKALPYVKNGQAGGSRR